MLLAVNVGNTQIKLALYRGRGRVANWTIATDRDRTADEYAMLWQQLCRHASVDFPDIRAVAIASVVPPLAATFRQLCQTYLGCTPLEVGPGIRTGMRILYDNPPEVGADRIANAIAAYAAYGGPTIIVDFGTATTFTAVSPDGDFLGGAICPGIGISLDALVQHAAQLRKVEIIRPPSIIARNTIAAIQSGVLYGFAGQVDGMVGRMRQELGGRATVVATGGYAALIASETPSIAHVDPLLALDGLRILSERNASPEGAGEAGGRV
ncbi:MAG TPA: type III pantothenate kinase [bacterium]|nr:type III pantothenate kinase [bacterium]